MYPLDPAEPGKPDPKPPMESPFLNENPNVEMTRKGLRIAENEKRDSVNEEYEKRALGSSEEEEILDDIPYPKGENAQTPERVRNPELSAMKKDPEA